MFVRFFVAMFVRCAICLSRTSRAPSVHRCASHPITLAHANGEYGAGKGA
jgi:hypothetical protein